MSFFTTFQRHMPRTSMRSIPSWDPEDDKLSQNQYYQWSPSQLIKRKAVGSSPIYDIQLQPWTTNDGRITSYSNKTWLTKWNRVGPILGLSALVTTLLSIPIAFGILRASDGDMVSAWKYSPNVYLAVMTAITGKTTSLAALQGAVITWWLRAMQGSSFEQLHHDWKMGQNVWFALLAGRRTNIIAIACIFGTLAAIDAPLLQRASSVVSKPANIAIPLNISLVQQLPGYYSGQATNIADGSVDVSPSTDFYPVMLDWFNNSAIPGIVAGCSGTCSITVHGPMIALNGTSSTSRYINYTQPLAGSTNLTWWQQESLPEVQNRTGFYSSVTSTVSRSTHHDYLALVTGMSDEQAATTCGGNYTYRSHFFASAIGEYDLIVQNNQTKFAGGTATPRFVRWSKNAELTNATNLRYNRSDVDGIGYNDTPYNTTFAGFIYAGGSRYFADATFVPNGWQNSPVDNSLNTWILQHALDYSAYQEGALCLPRWIDPLQEMVAGLNELAFRIAVHTSRPEYRHELTSQQYVSLDPGIEIDYMSNGLYISNLGTFQSDYFYFLGAAFVQVVCVAVIMYTYYGWWRLGRAVSFSPVEIAKAFEAPLLQDVDSNANADEMANVLGSQKARYGIVGSYTRGLYGFEAEKLAFDIKGNVQIPLQGTTFRQ